MGGNPQICHLLLSSSNIIDAMPSSIVTGHSWFPLSRRSVLPSSTKSPRHHPWHRPHQICRVYILQYILEPNTKSNLVQALDDIKTLKGDKTFADNTLKIILSRDNTLKVINNEHLQIILSPFLAFQLLCSRTWCGSHPGSSAPHTQPAHGGRPHEHHVGEEDQVW